MRWFWRIPGIFFTFNLVCFGWLMFRAESMKTVQLMLHQIFTNFNPSVIPQVLEGYAGIFLLVGIGYLLRPLGATIRHLPADGRTGSPGRVRHLAGDAGQVERYPAFHLLPILNDLCTPATNPCFWLSISTAVPAWTGS